VTNLAEQPVTLPTGRFLMAIWTASGAAAVVWAIALLLLPREGWPAWLGAAGGGIVGGSASLVLLLLRPWRARKLGSWPMLWMTASFLKWLPTLAGAFLLYSAAHFSRVAIGGSVLLAYLAVLVGETRVYAESMKRFVPRGAETDGPGRSPT
jgi:hypothetical protein